MTAGKAFIGLILIEIFTVAIVIGVTTKDIVAAGIWGIAGVVLLVFGGMIWGKI